MIKANVSLTGTIAGNIQKRQNTDGSNYVAFPLNVTVYNKNKETAILSVYVNVENGSLDETRLKNGKRLTLEGTLDIRSKNKILTFYLVAKDIKEYDSNEADGISGDMMFRGKLGNRIDERKTKKGETFVSTSGYYAEKVSDKNYEFTWTNLLWFNHSKESWMQPKTKVDVQGALRIEPYRNAVSLSCNVTSMAVTVEPAQQNSGQASANIAMNTQSEDEEQPF